MPRADVVDGRIRVDGVAFRDRDMIRELPGGQFSKVGGDHWTCPLRWPVLRILLALFEGRCEPSDALRAWAWAEYEAFVAPTAEARALAEDPDNDAPGDARLYPYQRTGTDYMVTAGSAALIDDPGCGKTATVISTLEARGAYPALVVATTAGKSVWRREYALWAPHRDVAVVTGGAAARRKTLAEEHDVYVIGWGALRLHTRLAPYGSTRLTAEERRRKELNAIEWAAVVADEAHRAITPRAKQTRALWAVSKDAGVRIPLTGTPIQDNARDFWSLLHFAEPDEWPSRTKFVDRYVETSIDQWGGTSYVGLNPDNEDEFHELAGARFLRRPKKLVLPWLPDKAYVTMEVDMTPAQRRAYDSMADEMVADIDGGTMLALDQLTLSTRLTQLASATVRMGDDGRPVLCAPSNKVDALMEYLEDRGKDPLIVAAQSRQLIMLVHEAMERHGVSHSMIVGGMSERAREAAEEDFQKGRVRCVLLTMAAGGESITLTRADTLVRIQRSWSLLENTQTVDRFHRPGQEGDKCLIVDLVAPGTIEERQVEAVQDKGDRLEEIVRDRRKLRGAIRG